MISTPEKRHTQIDLETLGGLTTRSQTGFLDRLTEGDTPRNRNASARKRLYSPDRDDVDPKTGLQRFRLPEAIKSGVRAHEYVRTKHGSPWRIYEKTYQLRLGIKDWVAVAERRYLPSNVVTVRSERKDPLSNLVIVRSFSGPNVEEKLRKFQQIQHANFVSALEVFRFNETSYVIFEFMAYSLYYVAGNPLLNEIHLAAILGQVKTQQRNN